MAKKTKAPSPKPNPKLKRLETFAGRWKTKGEIIASGAKPAAKIVGTDTYEWAPGGFFMIHYVDVKMAGEPYWAVEIIGYDISNGRYTMRSFDSNGESGIQHASVRNGVWTFKGKTLRATVEADREGKTLTAFWERKSGRSKWEPWLKMKFTKRRRTN